MSEWLQITLAIMGGLITLMTLWNLIEQRVNKTKEPTSNLEERVTTLERKYDYEMKAVFERYDSMLGRDKARLDSNDSQRKNSKRPPRQLLRQKKRPRKPRRNSRKARR